MAINAKFGGKCARTGKSYKAGTLIEKVAGGWAIASRGTTAATEVSEPQWIRFNKDGKLAQHSISQIQFCGCCKKRPNFDSEDVSTYADCAYERRGDDLVCPVCGNTIHILSDSEVWNDVILPKLHVTANGTLSHKIGEQKWAVVGHMFRYDSYADLAEHYDDMDMFDIAAMYEGMRGGQWSIKHPHTTEEVEEALGILPQNRRAVLDVQEKEEQEAEAAQQREAARVKAERDATFARLFDRAAGEYVPKSDAFDGTLPKGTRLNWGKGFTIYGTGTEIHVEDGGQWMWKLENNGMDGDDWSRNNVRTGGAGAVGFRFAATDERLAFVRTLPGGELLALPDGERRQVVLRDLKQRALIGADAATLALFPDEPSDASRHGAAIWVRIGEQVIGMPLTDSVVYLKAPTPSERMESAFHAFDFEISDNASAVYLQFPATSERVAALRALWPDWVGTAALGRYRVERSAFRYVTDNAADAVRVADIWTVPVNRPAGDGGVSVTPGVTITHDDAKVVLWSDGLATKLSGGMGTKLYSDARNDRDAEARDAARIARGEEPYRLPRGTRFEEAGFPPVPPLVEAPLQMSADASRLVNLALGQASWREGKRYERLYTVASVSAPQKLDEWEQSRSRSGQSAELSRVIATHTDGHEEPLWRVTSGWWSMGEDGDASETTHLYDDETDAREAFVASRTAS